MQKRPLTITVANAKGGVGKTTIIRYLSFTLSNMGKKVLVIDADPQANLTKTMLITKDLYSDSDDNFVIQKTMMAGVVERDLSDLVIPIKENLFCIPSHIDFKNFPKFLTRMYGDAIPGVDSNYKEVEYKRISLLKELIEPLKQDYDFILIDTPPTASDYVRSATFASDYLIIAFQTQSDSLDGAVDFMNNEVSELVEVFGSQTDVVGVLPNQLTKGMIDTTVINDAIELFGEQNLFSNFIPFAKRAQSVPRTGLRIDNQWDKATYENIFVPLTKEFLERIEIFEEGK